MKKNLFDDDSDEDDFNPDKDRSETVAADLPKGFDVSEKPIQVIDQQNEEEEKLDDQNDYKP
jgi:hypothetical protein